MEIWRWTDDLTKSSSPGSGRVNVWNSHLHRQACCPSAVGLFPADCVRPQRARRCPCPQVGRWSAQPGVQRTTYSIKGHPPEP
jgi:hypothetical protein